MSACSGSKLCRQIWRRKPVDVDICFRSWLKTGKLPFRRFSSESTPLSSVSLGENKHRQPTNALLPLSFLRPHHSSACPPSSSISPVQTLHFQIEDLLKANKPEKAYHLLSQIYRSGNKPAVSTYNLLIKSHARHFSDTKHFNAALKLLDEMAIHGIEPTSQTYMQLLMGEILHKPVRRDTLRNIQSWFDKLLALEARRNYKRTGSKLKRIFTLMAYVGHPATRDLFLKSLSVNIKYDLDSWNLAILACARGGQLDAAEDLLQMLRRQSGTTADGPTLESYHHVIRGYLGHYDSSHFDSPFRKQPDVDAAIRIFQLMLKDNVVADYTVYASFLKAYASDNLGLEADEELRIETLQRLWQAMMTMSEKDTVHFDDALLESLIDIFTRHNALSYAEQIYWDIRQREHPISRRNLSSIHQLIIAFARRVQLLSAMSLFYDLMACGHRPSSLVMCEIIRACGKRNDIELAEQMLSVVEETQKATDPILRVAKSCHHALKIQRDTARRQCTSSIS